MQCDFVGPESNQWSRLLTGAVHDFYHLPEYVVLSASDRLSAPDANGQALAFLAEEDGHRLLIALVVRPLPDAFAGSHPLFDAISPYGYACPLIVSDNDKPMGSFLQSAFAEFQTQLQDRRIVSVFLRTHPLIPFPLELLSETGCLVHHGQTVYIDLTQTTEELWRQTRADHRSGINKSKRHGFVVEFQSEWDDFDGFFRAYTQTMNRVQANDNYFFPREYFLQLRQAVGPAMHLVVCKKEGQVACAGLFSEVSGIVQFHLSGTIDEFYNQYPTKLMLDAVRNWAKLRGNHVMHLGGGYGAGEDSLFQFKAGFSHLRALFHTWRFIPEPAAYDQLCRQWEQRTGKTVSGPEGFFPAYRAPV